MFSKKATKIDEIFTVDLTLCSVKSTVKISSIFVAFLENMNFTRNWFSKFGIEDNMKCLDFRLIVCIFFERMLFNHAF